MTAENLINAATAVSWGSLLAAGAYYMFCSTIFDIKYHSAQKDIKKHPYMRSLRYRPLLTVVIIDDSSRADELRECIKALGRSGYRKYELVFLSQSEFKKIRNFKYIADGNLVLLHSADNRVTAGGLKKAVDILLFNNLASMPVQLDDVSPQSLSRLRIELKKYLIDLPRQKKEPFKRWDEIKLGVVYRIEELNHPARFNQMSLAIKTAKNIFQLSWFGLFIYFVYLALAHRYPLLLGLYLLSIFIYSFSMVIAGSGQKAVTKLSLLMALPGGLAWLLISLIAAQIQKVWVFLPGLHPVKQFRSS